MEEDTQARTYPTEEAALRRAAQLQAAGIWPGVVRCGDRWRLTADPDIPRVHRPGT